MEQEKTQHQILQQLVVEQKLSQQQADDIYYAPRFSFSIRELVSYLAGLIIATGVIRIIAFAFEDASQMSISIALYAVSVVAGVLSWQFSKKSELLQRFGEVLELGAAGAFAGASALALDEANMRGEWAGVVISSAAVLWGLFRVASTRFAGTLIFVVGVFGLSSSLGAAIDLDSARWGGIFNLIAGVVLIAVGLRSIHAAILARGVGALMSFTGAMMLANEFSNAEFLPIVIGAALFAVGSTYLAPELLLAGAICIVAGIVMTTFEYIDNDLAQGLVIIGTGLAILGVLSVQMRRALKQQSPGVQAA